MHVTTPCYTFWLYGGRQLIDFWLEWICHYFLGLPHYWKGQKPRSNYEIPQNKPHKFFWSHNRSSFRFKNFATYPVTVLGSHIFFFCPKLKTPCLGLRYGVPLFFHQYSLEKGLTAKEISTLKLPNILYSIIRKSQTIFTLLIVLFDISKIANSQLQEGSPFTSRSGPPPVPFPQEATKAFFPQNYTGMFKGSFWQAD